MSFLALDSPWSCPWLEGGHVLGRVLDVRLVSCSVQHRHHAGIIPCRSSASSRAQVRRGVRNVTESRYKWSLGAGVIGLGGDEAWALQSRRLGGQRRALSLIHNTPIHICMHRPTCIHAYMHTCKSCIHTYMHLITRAIHKRKA